MLRVFLIFLLMNSAWGEGGRVMQSFALTPFRLQCPPQQAITSLKMQHIFDSRKSRSDLMFTVHCDHMDTVFSKEREEIVLEVERCRWTKQRSLHAPMGFADACVKNEYLSGLSRIRVDGDMVSLLCCKMTAMEKQLCRDFQFPMPGDEVPEVLMADNGFILQSLAVQDGSKNVAAKFCKFEPIDIDFDYENIPGATLPVVRNRTRAGKSREATREITEDLQESIDELSSESIENSRSISQEIRRKPLNVTAVANTTITSDLSSSESVETSKSNENSTDSSSTESSESGQDESAESSTSESESESDSTSSVRTTTIPPTTVNEILNTTDFSTTIDNESSTPTLSSESSDEVLNVTDAGTTLRVTLNDTDGSNVTSPASNVNGSSTTPSPTTVSITEVSAEPTTSNVTEVEVTNSTLTPVSSTNATESSLPESSTLANSTEATTTISTSPNATVQPSSTEVQLTTTAVDIDNDTLLRDTENTTSSLPTVSSTTASTTTDEPSAVEDDSPSAESSTQSGESSEDSGEGSESAEERHAVIEDSDEETIVIKTGVLMCRFEESLIHQPTGLHIACGDHSSIWFPARCPDTHVCSTVLEIDYLVCCPSRVFV